MHRRFAQPVQAFNLPGVGLGPAIILLGSDECNATPASWPHPLQSC